MNQVVVPTEIWVPDPEQHDKGYLMLERRRTIEEVYEDLRRILGRYPAGAEESFSIFPPLGWAKPSPEWPKGRIACFAVTGSNEGHYVHVEVHPSSEGTRELVLIGKTFQGADAAWALARRLADLLEA